MDAQDVAQVRNVAKTVVRRAINDEAFGNQLRSQPRTTLLEAGMPEQFVDDFNSNELGLEPDVGGYMIDRCVFTCYLTIPLDE